MNKQEIRAKAEVMANKINRTSRYTATRTLYDCLGAIADRYLTDAQKRMVKKIKEDKNNGDIA
jgi:predicted nucleotidyltransferase component of viral defense system